MKPAKALLIVLLAAACAPARSANPGAPREGRWQYVADWPRLPAGYVMEAVSSVAIDTDERVIIVHRGGRVFNNIGLADTAVIKSPVVVELDAATGTILGQWGAGVFLLPHSISIDRAGNRWFTDVGRQQVLEFSRDGRLLRTVGEWKVAGSDGTHFNLPTDVAFGDDGSFYVSDGYRNTRIAHFDSSGRYIGEWGAKGNGPGQFNTPHGLARDAAGNFYVADRENFRVQVFDPRGQFLREWPAEHRAGQVGDVAVSASGTVYLNRWNDPDAVAILDSNLRQVGRIPFDSASKRIGHNIAVQGDSVIYLADTGGRRILKFVKR